MVALVVVNPGHSSTIQDKGRPGHREWGVPLSGAFDPDALAIANGLLGNAPGTAALELTLLGGLYEARIPLAVALAGAPMATTLLRPDGTARSLPIPLCFSMGPGDRLQIGGTEVGVRTYLAVRGGWRSKVLLGSRSDEARLRPGRAIQALPGSTPTRYPQLPSWLDHGSEPIRILDGPDAPQVVERQRWLESEFRVTPQCDRMGLRLAGAPVSVLGLPDRLSRPVTPGTIQVAGGQLLVLGVGCGTMGGYPQVAQVISADLARVGQLREGDLVRFRRIGLDEARALDREKRERMRALGSRLTALANDGPPSLAPH